MATFPTRIAPHLAVLAVVDSNQKQQGWPELGRRAAARAGAGNQVLPTGGGVRHHEAIPAEGLSRSSLESQYLGGEDERLSLNGKRAESASQQLSFTTADEGCPGHKVPINEAFFHAHLRNLSNVPLQARTRASAETLPLHWDWVGPAQLRGAKALLRTSWGSHPWLLTTSSPCKKDRLLHFTAFSQSLG